MPFPSLPSPPALLPTYLVPSISFRRKSSTDSTGSLATLSSPSSSPPTEESYLAGHASHLKCSRCLSDLALSNQIISKGFTGRHGRAYLVAPSTSSISPNPLDLVTAKAKNDALPNLPNTYTHKPVPRQLVTGAHTVGDISCAQCGSVLGWKYVAAEEESQRYKVGKFILETKRVCRSSTWENEDGPEEEAANNASRRSSLLRRRSSGAAVPPPSQMPAVNEEVEFDSEDEDECEDLFLGIWTPQSAAKRRKAKAFRQSSV
ncbi:yippee-domain-containing protein [Polychaeton citri CBS 116435]|uniref:Yippee-domain-containing protein n=1 Tax=Polychaeton citri CBS 116435 TaxID=1314669 RepID=A0A9P4Q2D3_9PEZI|nr:yippee-domain-containing protein [Polychaeton citri CBS 116435]